jgi:hypothetical protein
MRATETIRKDLASAVALCDSRALEDAVYAAFEADLPPELAEVFAQVLLLPWHFRHEDIATALQRMKDPRTVPALFAAASAKHAYLAYDETCSLARRCLAALSAIGTDEARARVAALASGGDAIVAKFAQRRLETWGRGSIVPPTEPA